MEEGVICGIVPAELEFCILCVLVCALFELVMHLSSVRRAFAKLGNISMA